MEPCLIVRMPWQKVTVVGVGLLGGSLGLALKERGLAKQVCGYVRRESSIVECEKLGVVGWATRDLLQAVNDADLVVLCTPLAQMRDLTQAMSPGLKRGALVTDVGSVKASVVQLIEPLVSAAGACFVGSHPMAGAEKMGAAHARSTLFVDSACVVTPTSQSKREAVQQVQDLWNSVGARVMLLSPELHDEFVSRSSHLPHVVAAELANYVLSPAYAREQALLCATGFRDTTRIASGSPEMWRDIAMANRKNLARVLGVFIEDLQEFQLALERGDTKVIQEFFATAKHRRDEWRAQNASHSPE
ncbi:MAG: prephenate dehydrogenase/arogenate dehydrogenase family protein [Verrucomicrobiota bacterium]